MKGVGRLMGISTPIDKAGLGMLQAGVGVMEGEEGKPFYPSGSYLCLVGEITKPNTNVEDMDMALKLWEWTETEMKKKQLIS
jgi:hypothetical protein